MTSQGTDSELKQRIIQIMDLNPDKNTGGVGQELIDYYTNKFQELIAQERRKAAIEELDDIVNTAPKTLQVSDKFYFDIGYETVKRLGEYQGATLSQEDNT